MDTIKEIKNSHIVIVILSDTIDEKIALEVGAAILFNKPIILVSSKPFPKHLLELNQVKQVAAPTEKSIANAMKRILVEHR